ncbi:MAG: VanZ family protein [Alphaproteobacteria bacterium]
MRFLLFLVACLIVYGSLYPFQFDANGFTAEAFDAFLTTWTAPTRRGDTLGNIALFMPLGLIGQVCLPPRGSAMARFALLLASGFVLAAGVQVLQLFTPDRDPALVDVTWNMVGLVLGAAPAFLPPVRALFAGRGLVAEVLVPVLLLACWFGSLLVPFVPSIDMQLWKDGLKPLFLRPEFVVDQFARDMPAWLAAACLGAVVVGERWLPVKLAFAAAAALGLKVVIIRNTMGLTDVVAAGVAVLALVALARLPRRELAVAGLLLLGYLYVGLSPFETRPDSPDFSWIPFGASLRGSMINNAAVVAYKAFFAGALVWLLVRAGAGYIAAAIVGLLATGIVEVGQLFVGDGTPEITDPLLALAAAIVIAVISPSASKSARATRK